MRFRCRIMTIAWLPALQASLLGALTWGAVAETVSKGKTGFADWVLLGPQTLIVATLLLCGFLCVFQGPVLRWGVRLTPDRVYLRGWRRDYYRTWDRLGGGRLDQAGGLRADSIDGLVTELMETFAAGVNGLRNGDLLVRALRFYLQNRELRGELGEPAAAKARLLEFRQLETEQAERIENAARDEDIRKAREWPSHWPQA